MQLPAAFQTAETTAGNHINCLGTEEFAGNPFTVDRKEGKQMSRCHGVLMGFLMMLLLTVTGFAQIVDAEPAGEELRWQVNDLGFKGYLVPDTSVSLRPESGSGVSLRFQVYDLKSNRLLVNAETPVAIYPKAARVAEVWPDMRKMGDQFLHSFHLELLNGGTFQLTKACNWRSKCFPGSGTVTGKMAERVMQAARKEEPNQAKRDQRDADFMFEELRRKHESMMRMLSPCQPGRYCY